MSSALRLLLLAAAISGPLFFANVLQTGPAAAGPSADPGTIVAAHNAYRKTQCAGALKWSSQLAADAQAWANQCTFAHSPGAWKSADGYGENLYRGSGSLGDAGHAVKWWYDEVNNYNFGTPTWSNAVGHFTQVVWKGSKQVGCGVAACGDKTYWVCRYTPTGNWNTNQPTVLTANVGCSKLDQWGVVKKPPPGTADAIKRYYPKQ